MSDRMAGEIRVGGKISLAVVPQLCDAITREGVSTEWGGGHFRPATTEELLAAVQPHSDQVPLLCLYDDDAAWGEFASLERFLEEHQIAFTRFSEGKYEYEPEMVAYRPSSGRIELLTNGNREPVIAPCELAAVEKELSRIVERARSNTRGIATAVRKARDLLHDALPPSVPALEPFEIVDGSAS